jgi:hypothetical protein
MNSNWIQITDFRGRLVFINLSNVCSVIFCDTPDNEHVTLTFNNEKNETYTGEAIEIIRDVLTHVSAKI